MLNYFVGSLNLSTPWHMGEQALYRTEQAIDYSDIFIQFQSQELLFMK